MSKTMDPDENGQHSHEDNELKWLENKKELSKTLGISILGIIIFAVIASLTLC